MSPRAEPVPDSAKSSAGQPKNLSAHLATFADVSAHFSRMLPNCKTFAEQAKSEGRPVVGIMCEFTPRELILAAGAVPVCLCGGSADTISDAESVLPANLCPLIKSTFGFALQMSNPFLEMADLVVGDLTCEGKKKMLELLAERKPVCALGLAHRSDDPEAYAYWLSEVRRLKAELERRFGNPITRQSLLPAIQQMNRERALRREIAGFMAQDPPPISGREVLRLKSIISCIPNDLQWLEAATRILRATPAAPARRSRVRVLMTGVPMVNGAERVLELIESCHAVVVAMENCTGLKPLLEDVDETAPDLVDAVARKYFRLPCAVMTPNNRRLDTLRDLARRFRPDCIVDLVWHACLTYDIESARVRKLAQDELRLPYLKINTDYSDSDSARIQTRIEALVETARGRGE